MSVSLMISNPINENEEYFHLPISTERIFEDHWMPIITELDLKWARCFQGGIELDKEDIKEVLKELDKMQKWITIYKNNDRGKHMLERLKNVNVALLDFINNSRGDLKIYIG